MSTPPSSAAARSPNSPHRRNPLVAHAVANQLLASQCRYELKWGAINVVLLAVLLLDLAKRTAFGQPVDLVYWAEYGGAVLLAVSVLFHCARFAFNRWSMSPVCGTSDQRRLLRFDESDSKSFVTTAAPVAEPAVAKGNAPSPLNVSNLSWHSSFNESNRSIAPNGTWLYGQQHGNQSPYGHPSQTPRSAYQTYNNTPQHRQQQSFAGSVHNHSQSQLNASGWSAHNNSSLNASGLAAASAANASFTSPYKNYNKREIITDEHELLKYMKSINHAAAEDQPENDVNTLNTFRSYCNSAANLLKTSLYQMSPASVSPSKPLSSAKDDLLFGGLNSSHPFHHHLSASGPSAAGREATPNANAADGQSSSAAAQQAAAATAAAADADESLEVLQRLSSTGQLTQNIYNLRGWLAVTILQRLTAEIDKTNRALAENTHADCRGFTDVQIGKVGLERLRKTADVPQLVGQHVPMLPKIVEFVQVTGNQEYLVQRIRDLARGCVLAEYRWNGGGTYNGIAWDEHLPSDSALLFHFFCTYLDGQLPPLPQPGGRPFYNRYVVHGDKRTPDEIRAEVRNKSGCAILVTNATMRPKFNFVTTRTIHSCAYDRNNLFYVIVEFLVYMRTNNEGMLENVNLGRSGINLLRVLGE